MKNLIRPNESYALKEINKKNALDPHDPRGNKRLHRSLTGPLDQFKTFDLEDHRFLEAICETTCFKPKYDCGCSLPTFAG